MLTTGRPRAAALGRAGVVGVLLGLSVLLLTGRPSAETPGVTSRESVVSGTTDGDADGPSANSSISADGRWVAFDSAANNLTDDPGSDFRRVFLRDRETLETSVVSIGPDGAPITGDARNPSVSADGSHVAFEADVVRPPVEIDVRPETERIVYTSNAGGAVDIYTAWADGSDPQQLTDTPEAEADPAFSPDRSRIAFSRDGEVWIMDANGGNPEVLTESPPDTFSDQPAWAPDGTRIAFRRGLGLQGDSSEPGGIFVVDLDPRATYMVTDSTFEVVGDAWPDWSPDGRMIAFSGHRGEFTGENESSIYVVELDHDDGQAFPGDLSQVTDGALADSQPRWHPWRETLVFTRTAVDGEPSSIWTTDVVPALVVLGGDVTAAAVEGDAPQPLTDDAGNDSRPAWTGEGLAVTFASDRSGETASDLFRVPLSLEPFAVAGDPERITAGNPLGETGVTEGPHQAHTHRGLGTPAGLSVTLRGQEGQPTPQGSVRFEVFPCAAPDGIGCTPPGERIRQMGGLVPVTDNGDGSVSATSQRTDELTPPYDFGAEPDYHCLAADYSGDGFYRSTRHTDPDTLCFRMSRVEPSIVLEPMTNGSTGGLIAQVQGPEGVAPPTGMVTFHLCGPDAASNTAGCAEGGEQVDWVEPLVEGSADVFAPELSAGRYCWRVEYAGDFTYHPRAATNTTSACFLFTDQIEPEMSGTIPAAGEFSPGAPLGLNAEIFAGEAFGGAPPGRGFVWLCGPDEVGPRGCVEGGTLLDSSLGPEGVLGPNAIFTASVPGELTQQFGTYCFRIDYRWPEGANPEEQNWVEKSFTDTANARNGNDAMCFDVVDGGFDRATSLTSVFVHDRVAGETVLVSETLDSEPANGDSSEPSISGDGTLVAFTSEASNLTTDDLLVEGENVFLRDLGADPPATTLVSVPQAECPDGSCFGGSSQPSISADGSHVAFTTNAFHLDVVNPPDPDFLIGEFTQVVVRDLAAGTTAVESLGPDGQAGFGNSFEPSIDADGSRVAFTSDADELVRDDDDLSFDDVFVRDRAEGITYLASIAEQDGELADGPSGEPSISTDGRTVAFSSFATNLVPDHPCADSVFSGCPRSEVFVNPEVGGAGLLSVDPDGNGVEEPWASSAPAVAGVGRFVAFESENPELVPGDGNQLSDVFVRDRTPVLVLTPDPLDFGPVLVGEPSAVGTVVGVNAGAGPLEVTGASLTGGDVADFAIETTDCTGAVLHRTETCTVDVRFTPQAEGPRSAVLEVDSTDPEGPRQVTLTGVGTRALAEVTPDPVDFGGWPVGVLSDPAVATFVSVGSAPVTVDSVVLAGTDPGDFEIADDACSGQTLLSLEGCGVTVRFRATAEGPREATLVFTDDAEGSPRSVTLVGRGLEPVAEVSPDPVDFAEQDLGTTSDPQVVTLINAFPLPDPGVVEAPLLFVSDVVLEGADPGEFSIVDSCSGRSLAPGESCQVDVRFSPTMLGERTAQLTFADNAPGSPRSVTLLGTGRSPEVPVGLLEVTPDVVDYGVVPQGEASPVVTATARNVGTGAVAVGDLALAGAGAAQYQVPPEGDGCSGTTLLPGTSCGVAVVFAPVVTGAHTATLQVPSDAENGPHGVDLAGLTPLVEPLPALGPPGFVPEIVGSDFPANTELVLAWEPGIGSRTITTDDEGSFSLFLPVLYRDQIGPRSVEARGDGFTIAADFLVVPGTLQPDGFVNRR